MNPKDRHAQVMRSQTFKHIAEACDLQNKRVLDLGCGYGEYMQRCGQGSVGITTTMAEVEYGKVNNIDIRQGNVELLSDCISSDERFDAFWANNLFEHLLSPHAFLVNMKAYAREDALLVLGVPMVPKIESLMRLRKFRGALASPHVSFFTKKTFELTVRFAGWDVIDNRGFVLPVPTIDRLVSPIIPHLYLIAKNNPNYRYPKKKLNEWQDDAHYQDMIRIMNGTGK